MKLLNLGAGNRVMSSHEGRAVVNHDLHAHRPEINAAWDLNVLPWPWQDEEFDAICAWAVLEHLHIDLLQSVNECWRILKPHGTLTIKLPYWNSEASYEDPTHYWTFAPGVFDAFDPTTKRGAAYSFYTERKWKLLESGFTDRYCTSISAKLEKLT